jgi:membrane fusion protein, copper/silver efflux system
MKKFVQCAALVLVVAGAVVPRSGEWGDAGLAIAADGREEPQSVGHVHGEALDAAPRTVAAIHQHDAFEAPVLGAVQKTAPIRVDGLQRRLAGIRTMPVEKSVSKPVIRAFGRVAPDETRVYKLDAGVNGFIREASSVTTGSFVAKDQWLATFTAPEALTPVQAYLVSLAVADRADADETAQVEVKASQATSSLASDRLLNIGMSTLQMEEIKATRVATTTIKILAPNDGIVLSRNVSPGQKFERGTEWYRIAALDRIWVLAEVYQDDVRYLEPGAKAKVSLPRRGEFVEARVSDAPPQLDPATRKFMVRLEMDNPGYSLRPGMFVDVDLPLAMPASLTVPVGAVLDTGLRRTVFVDRGDGAFEPRQVETGWRYGDRVEIVKGLEPGEAVVVESAFLLDSESRMVSVNSDANAEEDRMGRSASNAMHQDHAHGGHAGHAHAGR